MGFLERLGMGKLPYHLRVMSLGVVGLLVTILILAGISYLSPSQRDFLFNLLWHLLEL